MHPLTELLEKINAHDYNQRGIHEIMLSVVQFNKKLTNYRNAKTLKLKCLYTKEKFFFIIDGCSVKCKKVLASIKINFKSVYFIPTGFDGVIE